ncbi:MAG: CoA pyrophosphatase [Spirochaetia bacterium]|nr:CoA pyrophosphatase [Spirochaetia bacterium]
MSPAMRTSLEAYQPKTIMYDESRTLRPAAVALLIGRESGGIIFTVRSSSLPQHAGQISFPGGALDAGETPEVGALRVSEEEIGLPRARVQIMGALDKFQSVSDYFVHSFVGEWEESRLEHSRAERRDGHLGSDGAHPCKFFLRSDGPGPGAAPAGIPLHDGADSRDRTLALSVVVTQLCRVCGTYKPRTPEEH